MPLNDTEQLLGQMADFMNTRFFGKYRGKVTNVSDPENIGRIQASVPAVFGELDCPWAVPASPFAGPKHGLFLLPEVDDGVWIEFEGGNPSHPIWSGFWWGKDDEVPSPHTAKARVLTTSGGHQLVLDDDGGKVQLLYAGGADKGEITMSSSDITIKFGQCEIKIGQSEINVNSGMLKITTRGASLANDALKVGT
jgi:hypothetical protein